MYRPAGKLFGAEASVSAGTTSAASDPTAWDPTLVSETPTGTASSPTAAFSLLKASLQMPAKSL